MSATYSYDEVPYESQAYAQTHPDRLATLAKIFGLAPPEVSRCRVLELGCASGVNLIPMACNIPGGQFIGVELSRVEVDEARTTLDELGLENIRIEHASIMDVDPAWGQYDYIICHGVYSWVEPPVQDRILDIIAAQLAPNGVAYVSYNTYPGWHMREMIRHMMRHHAAQFDEHRERIAQSRALLDFLAAAVDPDSSAYGRLLHGELDLLSRHGDAYLYHEHLEPTNTPLYFHQFMERAESHGLQYLAEAEFSSMLTGRFPPQVAQTLERISPDILHLEQYMDFVRNRLFRQTLLCHAGLRPRRALRPTLLEGLRIASPARPATGEPDLGAGVVVTFSAPDHPSITTSAPATKAALAILGEYWPVSIETETLCEHALERTAIHRQTDINEARRTLLDDLFQCFLSGAIEVHTWQAGCLHKVSERPLGNAYAAHQAASRTTVVNSRHETVALDGLTRYLLPLLNGRRDRGVLLAELIEATIAGSLDVREAGVKVVEAGALNRILEPAMDKALASLARNALLMA